MPYRRALWLALLPLVLGPSTLASQRRAQRVPVPGLVVTARRGLSFGQLFRGTPRVVSPMGRGAALFEIAAPRNAQIQVHLLLPHALISETGEALQLVFGPGAGRIERGGRTHVAGHTFDPRHPVVTTITPERNVLISLGGTVIPRRDQPLAQYTGTVTVVVADLGT